MTLKQARQALGWNQEALAKESGVPQQRISLLERGEAQEDARKILNTLHRAGLKGITFDDLFSVDEVRA